MEAYLIKHIPWGQFEDKSYIGSSAFDANVYQLSNPYDGFDKIILQTILPNYPSESSTKIFGLVSKNSAKFLKETKGWKLDDNILNELGYILTDGPLDLENLSSFHVDLGWSKTREVRLLNSKIYLEVAEDGHCETCKLRIRSIIESLNSKNIKHFYSYLHDRYPKDARTLWIGIEIPQEVSDLAGLCYLLVVSLGVTVYDLYDVTRRL